MINTESSLHDLPASSEPENVLTVAGDFDPLQSFTCLRMQDGRVIRIPTSVLLYREDVGQTSSAGEPAGQASGDAQTEWTIPIIEEQLTVSRKTVPTGRVLLQKTVQEYQETLDEPLAVRTFDVERVILNQLVDSAPPVRTEGDITIYPLVEEQLILTKQLILREEVRVTKRDTERRDHQVVTLHREHLTVERQAITDEKTS